MTRCHVSFTIDFTQPRHGWIEVAVAFPAQRYTFAASHVLNDPIRELADLALLLASGEPGQCIATFWLEPAGYELSAVLYDKPCLVWTHWTQTFPRTQQPTVLDELAIDSRRAIASELMRSLTALRSLVPAEGDPAMWKHAFPAPQLERLAGLLTA